MLGSVGSIGSDRSASELLQRSSEAFRADAARGKCRGSSVLQVHDDDETHMFVHLYNGIRGMRESIH